MSDVLAVAEHRDGALRDVSFEVIAAARDLAESIGSEGGEGDDRGKVHVAIVGDAAESLADGLNREGVHAIHTITHDDPFNHDVTTQALTKLGAEVDPTVLLMAHSVNGMDYAPAVASALSRPLVTDAVDLAYAGDGTDHDGLTVTRELYGSKVETTIDVHADRSAVTIRPAEWPQVEGEGDATVESFDPRIDESAIRSQVTGFETAAGGDVDITDADVLVSIGRGIEEEDNLDIVQELADAMGATLSASRPIIDNGWLPKDRQVGQSGKVVTPDVYLAIGISGAVQHVAGMKGADTIIAINTDPNAPIFDIADYGIVGDLFDVVPALTAEFE